MLLSVSGKARSGKDTFARMLAKRLQSLTGRSFVLMAYAHELKIKVQEDFDLSYEQLWGDEKELTDLRFPKNNYGESSNPMDYWTPREIMQAYGQFYRTIDYDFWVKHLFNVIEENEYKNVIITDVRHINEVDAVVNRGGFHIRVERQENENTHNKQHISETALDDEYKIDFTVVNYWTLKELEVAAGEVAEFLIETKKLQKGRNGNG